MTNIPSEEEFARARRVMAEMYRNLHGVSGRIKDRLRKAYPIDDVFIFPDERDADFRVYVFFAKESDLEACTKSGAFTSVKDVVYEELERAGRGNRESLVIAFEWDSDEKVAKKFGGDYWLRMR